MVLPAGKNVLDDDIKDAVIKVSKLVAEITGNKLTERQYFMVGTKIKKRMFDLRINLSADYIIYLDNHISSESKVLVSMITTHHSFFFREFSHFEYLREELPDLVEAVKKRGGSVLKIWVAACSRGQEMYSLAMFLNYHLQRIDPTMRYEILGSDIDPECVGLAQNGVYHRRDIKKIPLQYLGDNWSRGTGEIKDYVRAKDVLRRCCRFKVLNLFAFGSEISNEMFDVVFCRNVFIYFEEEDIKKITKELMKHLQPSGFLVTGISEPLGNLKLDIKTVGPSIYTHISVSEEIKDQVPVSNIIPLRKIPVPPLPEVLRVLCVDDSNTVLSLLKRVLEMSKAFKVVATAANGLEAREMLKKHQIDVVTLDIHMPKMDGITYLRKYHDSNHPVVVMITSVSRDEADYAINALRCGASDFVEKPTLRNLSESSQEIITKLKVAYHERKDHCTVISPLDREFVEVVRIDNPDKKLRIVLSRISSQKRLFSFFESFRHPQPPTFLLLEGNDDLLEKLCEDFRDKINYRLQYVESLPDHLEVNTVYMADYTKFHNQLKNIYGNRRTSILVFGECSAAASREISLWGNNTQLLVEDFQKDSKTADHKVANDIVPATSFPYMSSRFLGDKDGQ